MYKVEYLVLLDDSKTNCKTVRALKSLLQADSNVEIDKNDIKYHGYTTTIKVKLGKKVNTSHLFFNISLVCSSEQDIEKFSSLLKAIRSSLRLLTETHYVIWDDLSLFYAQQAYPIVFNIENLMRQLITKFMLTNIGIGWTKDRVPTDVQQSINPNNKDINYLNNVDFIQLKNFLFSENYPNHKENIIKSLKEAKDFSNLNLEEIKSLLPTSNWNKYFEPIVGCDAEYLKKRWDKIYELRCNIAHNKTFNKNDLEEVKKLSSELRPYLEKALNGLEDIEIGEEERENVAENVVKNLNNQFWDFFTRYKQVEALMKAVIHHPKSSINIIRKHFTFTMMASILKHNGVITDEQFFQLSLISNLKNNIIHNSHADSLVTQLDMDRYENLLRELTISLKAYKDGLDLQ